MGFGDKKQMLQMKEVRKYTAEGRILPHKSPRYHSNQLHTKRQDTCPKKGGQLSTNGQYKTLTHGPLLPPTTQASPFSRFPEKKKSK